MHPTTQLSAIEYGNPSGTKTTIWAALCFFANLECLKESCLFMSKENMHLLFEGLAM